MLVDSCRPAGFIQNIESLIFFEERQIHVKMEKGEQPNQSNNVKMEKHGCYGWKKWLETAAKFNKVTEKSFYRYGYFISGHPWKVIIVCMLITASLGWGLVKIEFEARTEKLYVPQNSRAVLDLDSANKFFNVKARNMRIFIHKKNNENMLNEDALKKAMTVFVKILNETKIENSCIKTNLSGQPFIFEKTKQCVRLDPFQLFNYFAKFFSRENITQVVNERLKSQEILMTNGMPLSENIKRILGKVKTDVMGNITSAGAISFEFLLSYPETDKDYEEILRYEDSFIKLMESEKKRLEQEDMNLYFFAYKSTDDSIKESTGGDVKLFAITFTLMCAFTCLILAKFRSRVTGHALAGLVGLLAVAFGIAIGFGLVILCGVKFVSTVGILPFLILGVGIDDMFIILDQLDRTDFNLPTRHLMATVLSKIGGSVTMTTLTDLVAFAVSSTSAFPAIQVFCIFAAVGITCSFIMIMTFFVAFLKFDVDRIKKGRFDMIPCIKTDEFEIDKNTGLISHAKKEISSLIMNRLGKFLMMSYARYIVMVLSLGLLAAGIVGASNIGQKFTLQMLGRDGSNYIQFLDFEAKHFPSPIVINIVVPGSYHLDAGTNQKEYSKLTSIAMGSSHYMQKRKIDWFNAFKIWSDKTGRQITGAEFLKSLKLFLSIPANSKYATDLKLSHDGSQVIATKVTVFMSRSDDSSKVKEGMVQLRKAIDTQSKVKPYLAAMQFIYVEQYVLVIPEATRNVIISGVTVIIMTAPFLLHPGLLLLMVFSFAAFIVELLGLMYLWDVSLNSISLVVLTMAIGFAVDYSAHVGHAYITSKSKKAEDRIIAALTTAGASVFMGGFSTFLGMLVNAFASSHIFRIFFKMFFGIVVLGLLHGLIILPTFIAAFGIKAVSTDDAAMKNEKIEFNDNARYESQEVVSNPMTVS